MPTLALPQHPCHLQALVLDKDGVLQDFEASWIPVLCARAEAVAQAAQRPDLVPHLARAMGFRDPEGVDPQGILAMGTALEAMAACAHELHRWGWAWGAAKALVAQAWAGLGAAGEAQPVALPGAVAAVRALKAKGWRLALCTSDGPESTQRFLAHHQLEGQFDAVCTAQPQGLTKPDPELLRQVAALLGLPCAAMAMVGDTPADLEMARRAGVLPLGLGSGVSSVALLGATAEACWPDLAGLEASA